MVSENYIQAGSLEIHHYLPPALLSKPVAVMDMEEFLEALAQARYIQQLEENAMARAISKVFSE